MPDPTAAPLRVLPDHLEVTAQDRVLVARLEATLALCFYDAVEEPGALLHLRIAPPRGTQSPDLTDSVLAGDLMLLEQAMATLRQLVPAARYWQCKMVAHVPDAGDDFADSCATVVEFIRAYLGDSIVKLIDTQVRHGAVVELAFRPAMGELRLNSVS